MLTLTTRSFIASTLLALTLGACGDDGSPTTTVATTNTTGTTTNDTKTSDDGTSTGGGATTDDPTTGGTTTMGVNPCDQCDANALCDQNGMCSCKTGFEGNGLSCTDIDECGTGKDNCSADATCTNTDGGFTCDCKDGYDGDGFDCKDVDECAANLNNCSPVADCTNTDGAFTCKCKDGYTGDGVTCKGTKQFGADCELNEDCASGLCLTNGGCTAECSLQVAHDCRDQGFSGLCVLTDQPDLNVCFGDFNGGTDKEDTVMIPGDSIMRQFQTASDADVHLINYGTKNIEFIATPDLDDDLKLEVWDLGGNSLGEINNVGIGMPEGASLDVKGVAGSLYVIVRNIGATNGGYKFAVTEQ